MGSPAKMFKLVLTIFISCLVVDQGHGKQCFDCESNNATHTFDTCGDFPDSTKKCTLADGGSCYKHIDKEDGHKFVKRGCDGDNSLDGVSVCVQNNLKNKCKKINGITLCCCDEDLCNSATFIYGSVLVLLPSLMTQWFM